MRLLSWNINSLRHRLTALERLVRQIEPDVVCLQETKVDDALFPVAAIADLGFEGIAYRGQKAYHGVAIFAREPFAWVGHERIGRGKRAEEARHLAVTLANGLEVHNLYVPAGGDDPRPERNPKLRYKLRFIGSLARWMQTWPEPTERPRLLAGDLNVAPLETDVWSHQRLKRSVTHTEREVRALGRMQRSLPWIDVAREFVPASEKLFTWWSYRAADWRSANKGRRLDHVWVSQPLRRRLIRHDVLDEVRDWPSASDHAPIVVELSCAG